MNNQCHHDHLLSAFLDGELDEVERSRLQRHLAECSACHQRMESLAQIDAMVKGLPQIEPSAQFDQRFWSKVDALPTPRQKQMGWRQLFSGWRPVAAGALASGLIAALLFYSGMNRHLSPEEIFLAENAELLEEYELIDKLDILEHWDAIDLIKDQS